MNETQKKIVYASILLILTSIFLVTNLDFEERLLLFAVSSGIAGYFLFK